MVTSSSIMGFLLLGEASIEGAMSTSCDLNPGALKCNFNSFEAMLLSD